MKVGKAREGVVTLPKISQIIGNTTLELCQETSFQPMSSATSTTMWGGLPETATLPTRMKKEGSSMVARVASCNVYWPTGLIAGLIFKRGGKLLAFAVHHPNYLIK